MNLLAFQADDVVPDAWLRYVGACRVYAQRMQFFLGVPNTLMIAVLFYNDSAFIQSLFPTVWHWVATILFVVVPAAVAVDRIVLHPAQLIYNHHQSGRENRSPNYRETMATKRKVERLHDRLDDAGIARADGGDER